MYLEKAVKVIIKASEMPLLLCYFFYPLLQIYGKEITELNSRDSAFFDNKGKKNSENTPILYISEGTEVHNLENFSNVGKIVLHKTVTKNLIKSSLAKTVNKNKVKKGKPQVRQSSSHTKICHIHYQFSFSNLSEYEAADIVFTRTEAFHIKQGIATEEYKVPCIISEDTCIHHLPDTRPVIEMTFFNIKIRPPPGRRDEI